MGFRTDNPLDAALCAICGACTDCAKFTIMTLALIGRSGVCGVRVMWRSASVTPTSGRAHGLSRV
jgi:hypothetical protein